MLIEDYIHSEKIKFLALEFLHKTVLDEIIKNYGLIKQNNCVELFEKIQMINWIATVILKILQDEREEIRQKLNKDYKVLLQTEL